MREIRWIDGLWPMVCRNIKESVEGGRGHSALCPKQFLIRLASCGRVPRRSGLNGCHSECFEAGFNRMCDPSCSSRGNPCHGSVRFLGDEPCRPWAVWLPVAFKGSYLVDPASSHMLVSKIKPCMSKYKQLYGETANGSLNQL
jgi:hypothetical protein